ncbi:MAG: hypothetical protein GX770_09845 [Firmicutes bacterium]|nr:hypothetical protein [Bacillota bacterium]
MRSWARKRNRVLLLCCLFFVGTQICWPPLAVCGPDFFAARSDPEVPNPPWPEDSQGGSGLPETARLWWEQELTFQHLCLKNRTLVRLVAFRINTDDATPAERHNVGVATALLKGQVVPPGAVFSVNAALGPRTGDRNFKKGLTYFGAEQIQTYGGGICRLASALYNGAILANLEVIERWPHSMPVMYVPPGQDATIATYKDLKFRNSTTAPLVIWAEYKELTLYIAFYGREKPPKVKWHHEILARWPFTTEYRINPQLKPGEIRVISPGADGLRVRSWVTLEEPDGKRYRKRLGVDTYYPKRQMVEVNPLTFR